MRRWIWVLLCIPPNIGAEEITSPTLKLSSTSTTLTIKDYPTTGTTKLDRTPKRVKFNWSASVIRRNRERTEQIHASESIPLYREPGFDRLEQQQFRLQRGQIQHNQQMDVADRRAQKIRDGIKRGHTRTMVRELLKQAEYSAFQARHPPQALQSYEKAVWRDRNLREAGRLRGQAALLQASLNLQ